MIYTIGPISGCHLNPAVTLGLVMSGKFDARKAPGYMIAQVVGGILAARAAVGRGQRDRPLRSGRDGFATNGYGDALPVTTACSPASSSKLS